MWFQLRNSRSSAICHPIFRPRFPFPGVFYCVSGDKEKQLRYGKWTQYMTISIEDGTTWYNNIQLIYLHISLYHVHSYTCSIRFLIPVFCHNFPIWYMKHDWIHVIILGAIIIQTVQFIYHIHIQSDFRYQYYIYIYIHIHNMHIYIYIQSYIHIPYIHSPIHSSSVLAYFRQVNFFHRSAVAAWLGFAITFVARPFGGVVLGASARQMENIRY